MPFFAYQPRRPVPWGIIDVLLALSLYFIMPVCVVVVARDWLAIAPASAVRVDENAKLDTAHPLARVLLESPSAWAIVACMLTAVVFAPITEEFLFRLLLQGWLEAVERRLRRQIRRLRSVAAGVLPVASASLLFAALHFRAPSPRLDVDTLVFLICARAVANLLTLGLALCWVRLAAGATLGDLGIVPGRLWADIQLGMWAFLAITIPVYVLLIVATSLLPENMVADPIPLLLLAAVLGGLYYRTHRIVPAIVLHMAFNATSVSLALWTLW